MKVYLLYRVSKNIEDESNQEDVTLISAYASERRAYVVRDFLNQNAKEAGVEFVIENLEVIEDDIKLEME